MKVNVFMNGVAVGVRNIDNGSVVGTLLRGNLADGAKRLLAAQLHLTHRPASIHVHCACCDTRIPATPDTTLEAAQHAICDNCSMDTLCGLSLAEKESLR